MYYIKLTCVSVCLSHITGVLSRLGGNHGEAVAVCDAGSCHGSTCTDLPKALRVSDPFTQPGNPLCQEGSAFCAAEHWQAYSGATAGWQLRHEVTVKPALTRKLLMDYLSVNQMVGFDHFVTLATRLSLKSHREFAYAHVPAWYQQVVVLINKYKTLTSHLFVDVQM